VAAGFTDTKFGSDPGHVRVTVIRDEFPVLHFTTPEKITLHPLRTDLLTYSYSSEHYTFYQPLLKTP
jgi:hypothetical protein